MFFFFFAHSRVLPVFLICLLPVERHPCVCARSFFSAACCGRVVYSRSSGMPASLTSRSPNLVCSRSFFSLSFWARSPDRLASALFVPFWQFSSLPSLPYYFLRPLLFSFPSSLFPSFSLSSLLSFLLFSPSLFLFLFLSSFLFPSSFFSFSSFSPSSLSGPLTPRSSSLLSSVLLSLSFFFPFFPSFFSPFPLSFFLFLSSLSSFSSLSPHRPFSSSIPSLLFLFTSLPSFLSLPPAARRVPGAWPARSRTSPSGRWRPAAGSYGVARRSPYTCAVRRPPPRPPRPASR